MVFSVIKKNSERFQWIIFSLGSLNLESEFPEFVEDLAAKSQVAVFQLDPVCSMNSFTKRKGVTFFRYNYNFSFDESENDFYSVVTQLLNEKKNIVLTTCTLPRIPKEFILTAYQHRYALGTTLFLVSSFSKNSLAVVYNPIFLIEWLKILNDEIPWLENAPQEHLDFTHILKVTDGTYESLGHDDNVRSLRLGEIQKHFVFMGLIVEDFLSLGSKDLLRLMHPRLYKQPYLKLFTPTDQLTCHSSHSIYHGFKYFNPFKNTRNYIGQIFKEFKITDASSLSELQKNLAFAFIEVVVGEFYRFLMPETQPKSRFCYCVENDDYGILSTEIPNFLTIEDALELKKSNDPTFDRLKSKINCVGMEKILIACLFFGEFDLKKENLGIDWVTVEHLYKIDHGCCLPLTWMKYLDDSNNSNTKGNLSILPATSIIGNLSIPPDILDKLPDPGVFQNGCWTYGAYHWFGLIKEGISFENCGFLDPATRSKLFNQTNQLKVNCLLFQICLLSNNTIHAFVSAYKMQFMNIESKYGNHNEFIERVAADIELELRNRRNQLEIAAFRNKSFLDFLHSRAFIPQIQTCQLQLQNFIVFNNVRLAQQIRDPKELELIHNKPFLPMGFTTEEFSEEEKKYESPPAFQIQTVEYAFFFNSTSANKPNAVSCIENKV